MIRKPQPASSPLPARRRRCRSLLLTPLALLAGCASPGVPHPPSLRLPTPVTDLSATRIGDRVHLTWTAPTRTTDGLPVTFPTTVVVCRDPAQPPTVTCTEVLRTTGHSGPSTSTDALPAQWTSASTPGQALSYRIRILNGGGRSAAPSNEALVPAGPSLPPVQGLQAHSTREGVLLQWQGIAAPGEVDVLRTFQPSPTPATSKKRDTPPAEVHLRAQTSATPLPGMLDTGTAPGNAYLYSAQRVAVLSITGQTLEYRSEPTPPIPVLRHDTFPPDAPRGLLSVPGTTPTKPSIDLSWQPNTDPDLAGYFVYRADLSSPAQAPLRLTPTPIPGSAYSDSAVEPGRRYRYTVTAVDRTGNESPPSAPVIEPPAGER